MSKFCPKCGCENLDEASFCLECGASLPSIEEVKERSSHGAGTSHQSTFSSNLNEENVFNQETSSFSQSSSNSNEASNSSKFKNVINEANPANNDNQDYAICCLVIFVLLLIAFLCNF